MMRRPPSTTLFPYTALFRTQALGSHRLHRVPDDLTRVAGAVRVVQQQEVEGVDAAALEAALRRQLDVVRVGDRKSTRLNSSHANISYAVFCLKKKNTRMNSSRDVWPAVVAAVYDLVQDRKSPRLNSRHANISDAVLCFKNQYAQSAVEAGTRR